MLSMDIFRIFTILEMLVSNNNFNGLTFTKMELLFKIKITTLKYLADKFFNAVAADEELHNYDNDIISV